MSYKESDKHLIHEIVKELVMSQTKREQLEECERDIDGHLAGELDCQPTTPNMVDHPPHYNQGGIETIEYMRAYSTPEEFRGHCRLTAIKYLSRLNEKDTPLENAKKARWYIDRLIEELGR